MRIVFGWRGKVVMWVLLLKVLGGFEILELLELFDLVVGLGQVLVVVKVCVINFFDVLIIEDKYQFKLLCLFVLGGEIVGIIEQVGDGVEGWVVGDCVIVMIGYGGLLEKVIVDFVKFYCLFEGCSFVEGVLLILIYGMMIYVLFDCGYIVVGQILLVLGVVGGVGLVVIELGKVFGVCVVVVVLFEEKVVVVKQVGVDDMLIYVCVLFDKDQLKVFVEQFKVVVGKVGVDVIYDLVGGDYVELVLCLIVWEGCYLVVGFLVGILKLVFNLMLLKSCDVCGVFWGVFVVCDLKVNVVYIVMLFELWGVGKIVLCVIEIFLLECGGEVIVKMVVCGVIGKLVVEIV